MTLLIIGYIIGFCIAVPAMGPASAIIIRRALFGREREAFAFGVGSTFGEGVHTFAAVWGVELLFYLIPGLKDILKWVGIVVLIGLGLYFVIGQIPDDPEAEMDRDVPHATTLGKQLGFGFVITVVNPALIGMWSTAIGLLVSMSYLEFAHTWQRAFFPVTVMAGEITWFVLLVILAKRFGASADQQLIHWIIRGLGALLLGLGGWTLYTQVV